MLGYPKTIPAFLETNFLHVKNLFIIAF